MNLSFVFFCSLLLFILSMAIPTWEYQRRRFSAPIPTAMYHHTITTIIFYTLSHRIPVKFSEWKGRWCLLIGPISTKLPVPSSHHGVTKITISMNRLIHTRFTHRKLSSWIQPSLCMYITILMVSCRFHVLIKLTVTIHRLLLRQVGWWFGSVSNSHCFCTYIQRSADNIHKIQEE